MESSTDFSRIQQILNRQSRTPQIKTNFEFPKESLGGPNSSLYKIRRPLEFQLNGILQILYEKYI